MVNVVLAGGGTAGHISPMVATAEALGRASAQHQVACIGTARGLETRLVPAAGLELELVPPVPLPRKPTLDLAKVPHRLLGSVRTAARILERREAEVVVGFGGYVALPAYLAARRLGIPVVIHEQNAVPGLANKVAARFATRTLCAFPGTPLPGVEPIGMPMRHALTELAERGRENARREGAAALGLNPDHPTLLVSGGSQGARSINLATIAACERLLARGIQVLHVVGPKNFTDDMRTITDDQSGASYVPLAYVDDMASAYAAADLMLCRSGAGTVCEVGSLGLPAVFVPLPHGNGEQARNADALVAAGGGVLVPDAELDADRLLAEVGERITSAETLERMAHAGRQLFAADAADVLARVVLDVARPPRRARGADKPTAGGDDHVA